MPRQTLLIEAFTAEAHVIQTEPSSVMADDFDGYDLSSPNPIPVTNARTAAAEAERVRRLARAAAEAAETDSASGLMKRLIAEIQEFEKTLDPKSDVGLLLVSFGQANTLRVTSLGCIQPNLIVFDGLGADGKPVRLIQHMSQLSFLLTRIPRANPEEPRRAIGFHA